MRQKNIWDFWAGRYEKLWVQKVSLGPTRAMVLREIKGLLERGPAVQEFKLLDVGCGTGQLIETCSKELGNWKLSITGVDNSREMLELAGKKKIPGACFVAGDAQDLPFPDSQFDFVTCCHSFPYYPDQARALSGFLRVLKPGGCLLLIQAAEDCFYDTAVMRLVKLTTGKACYPSTAKIAGMLREARFTLIGQKKLPCRFFMPSIVLSIAKAEGIP